MRKKSLAIFLKTKNINNILKPIQKVNKILLNINHQPLHQIFYYINPKTFCNFSHFFVNDNHDFITAVETNNY